MSELLIHIGYHKTATTWLQKELFSKQKAGVGRLQKDARALIAPHALEFDSKRCRNRFQQRIQRIHKQKLIPVLSSENLSGNPHSGGYDSKEIADRLAAVSPESKILIVIREQQSAILSCYKQFIRAGGVGRARDYLQISTRGRFRIPLFRFHHFAYDRLIRYYMQLFGESHVLVLPFELFQRNPREFVERILKFSGAVPEPGVVENMPFHRKWNPSPEAVSLCLARLGNRVACNDTINPAALIRSDRAAAILRGAAITLGNLATDTMHAFIEKGWKEQFRMLVADRYAASNLATSRLTGLSLAEFGYSVAREEFDSPQQNLGKAA